MAMTRKPTKKPAADKLVKPGKKEDVELKEDQLKTVTGGSFSWGKNNG
jgi:hypothetical protein